MAIKGNGKQWQERQRLAQEAASILVQTGSGDYFAAKQKAAIHLGIRGSCNQPSNTEVEQALLEHQRIYRGDTQLQQLNHLRRTALRVMQLFNDFRPRLVGAVLNGSADFYSVVSLHVFTDTIENIAFFLRQQSMPYQLGEKQFRITSKIQQVYPTYQFFEAETPVDLVVFPLAGLHQAPLSPVDGRAMQRASMDRVKNLLKGVGIS